MAKHSERKGLLPMDSASPSSQLIQDIESRTLPESVPRFLDDRTRSHPDTIFLNFFDDDDALSYQDFTRLTKDFAQGLRQAGICQGQHVAVMLPTSRYYPITWIALSRLGAVTVPINVRYTEREIRFAVTDSESEFLIIAREFLENLPGLNLSDVISSDRIIVLENPGDHCSGWHSILKAGSTDSGLSYDNPGLETVMNIQYTSGTSGLPKGAILDNRYWLTFSRNGAAQFLDQLKRILVAQPFYYVDAQWLMLMGCWTGATLFIAREMHSSKFLEWLRKYHIEYCNFPEIVSRAPASSTDFMEDLIAMSCYSHRPTNFPEYEKRFGGKARQGFSMTEVGCALSVPFDADHVTGSGTVGVPVAYREARIVDRDGNVVDNNKIGEICIRGRGLFQGYYNNPKATRDAYHPGRWFKTGDIGKKDENGWFWYLGRIKDMVRRSGENISAVEVEQVLRGVDCVIEAAVLPVPDQHRGEEVKAYLRRAPRFTDDLAIITDAVDYCGTRLAPFKIPRYFECVDDFPRTPSNKIKKSDLIKAKPDLRVGVWDRVEEKWL